MNERLTCPKCAGTKRIALDENGDQYVRKYKTAPSWYDPVTDTKVCNNCGGQTMSGIASGLSPMNPATGLGCLHSYASQNVGRCLTEYYCKNGCGSRFQIDSGD